MNPFTKLPQGCLNLNQTDWVGITFNSFVSIRLCRGLERILPLNYNSIIRTTPILSLFTKHSYFWLWHSREPYKSLGPYCYCLCATNFESCDWLTQKKCFLVIGYNVSEMINEWEAYAGVLPQTADPQSWEVSVHKESLQIDCRIQV